MADQLTEDQKKIIKIIVDEAKKQGIDPEFAVSLANLESGFKHIPANDKESTSFGPFQVNKGTAQANNIDYDEMVKNPELATRAGVINLARHAKNPLFEGDPARIAAAHRYGENSEFAKTGDLESLKKDPVLRSYLTDLADHFEGAQLPESIYKEPEVEKKAEEKHTEANKENAPISTFPQPQIEIPRGVAGGVGAIGGAGAGALLGTKAALLRSKYDIAQLISAYPDAKAAFMAGKSPAEVASIALKHVTPSAQVSATTPASTLPDAQGPLTGNPAGGYQTQNWVASGDTQGRYTDVGLNARDKAEAHQMKLKAMEAEDKIRKIAPEFAADPNRANLFISQSAGRGPSPRFGGTPNVPIPSATPAVASAIEKPSIWSGLASLAKNYTPIVKYPIMGGLAGLNFGQGMADAYNKFSNKKYGEGALSLAEQGLGYVAPKALGSLELALHSGELNPNEEVELERRRQMAPTITGQ